MSSSPRDHESKLDATVASGFLTQVNRICQKFTEAWQSGQRPQIEEYLKDVSEAERDELLQELIHEEIALRRQSSHEFSVDQYVHRFPSYRDLVVQAFELSGEPRGSHVQPRAMDFRIHSTADIDPAAALENMANSDSRRYRKIRRLGEGSFGTVWLAEDLELHRQVAVKEPHSEHVANPAALETFLAEARTLASLDHPNIVPVYDTGRSDAGHCFVVSKVIDGPNLTERMKQGKLSIPDIVSLVSQIADALHYAHGKQIVHRDVKPDNILFDSSGKPWLSDFGIALHDDKVGTGSQIIGTPAYMSPEQVSGASHRVDGRTDVYSLGVILYELLTGRRPFRSEKQVELLEQIRTMDAKPLRQIDDTIPRELERICLKALSRSQTDRYPTAKDFADDLRAIMAAAPPSHFPASDSQEVDQRKRPVRSSNNVLFAIVSAVGVAVILFAGQWILDQARRPQGPSDSASVKSPDRSIKNSRSVDDIGPSATPIESDNAANPTPQPTPDAPVSPDLLINRFNILASRDRKAFEPAETMVPLRSGDHIRFAIEFSQPVFARLIWVDADGHPIELFPSDPSAGLRGTDPVTKIESPVELDTGWPVDGNSGMETAVLLISKTPLDTVPLELLTMKPRESLDNLPIATYFASRDVTPSRTASDNNRKRETRSLKPTPGKVDDPVMSLLESLRQHADVVQAISLLHSDEPLP